LIHINQVHYGKPCGIWLIWFTTMEMVNVHQN